MKVFARDYLSFVTILLPILRCTNMHNIRVDLKSEFDKVSLYFRALLNLAVHFRCRCSIFRGSSRFPSRRILKYQFQLTKCQNQKWALSVSVLKIVYILVELLLEVVVSNLIEQLVSSSFCHTANWIHVIKEYFF